MYFIYVVNNYNQLSLAKRNDPSKIGLGLIQSNPLKDLKESVPREEEIVPQNNRVNSDLTFNPPKALQISQSLALQQYQPNLFLNNTRLFYKYILYIYPEFMKYLIWFHHPRASEQPTTYFFLYMCSSLTIVSIIAILVSVELK